MLNATIKFFLENKLITGLLAALCLAWGLVTAPFDWKIGFLPRDPVPVDAIPDIGENQQIVFTEWMGRSPQDVEDQITYPLTSALLGLPGVKSIRSTSMFGFSSIYIIFDESVEYYWSRTRVLEKLASLSAGVLPPGISPTLGPDATALGQVFWYTLEGRDERGEPAEGWDPHELRAIQDFQVRPALASVEGVSEVASVGGFVKEYQVDLDPSALHAHGVGLMEAVEAVRNSNLDAGANTVEINLVEYVVRSLGYVRSLEDIEQAVVKVSGNVPIRVRDIAKVNVGPAPRGHGGFLDKGGAEATGGVVVARYGGNPLKIIGNVKAKIAEIAPGLPSKTLSDGRISRVTVIPFYDRTGLILETLHTLYEAISLQVLITVIVVLAMVMQLRASLAITALLPLAVLMCFILMRYSGVDANIVALSGIAIAIGTMVDLGIILTENVLRHQREAPPGRPLSATVYGAATEVSGAILTAVSTTIVSFLPVFTLQAAEGKLFGPLAYTKTFALAAALIITFLMLPALLQALLSLKAGRAARTAWSALLAVLGAASLFFLPWAGLVLLALGANGLLRRIDAGSLRSARARRLAALQQKHHDALAMGILLTAVSWLLTDLWMPLGQERSAFLQFLFVLFLLGSVLAAFKLFIAEYGRLLGWCLENKAKFLLLPGLLLLLGFNAWLGFDRVFAFVPTALEKIGWNVRATAPWSALSHAFPGMGKEFMPSLDEGSFLLMPTSMPHSGVDANLRVLKQLDMRMESIPEVEMAVGKAGRVESALDPAPISMFENIILYKSEYGLDAQGKRVRQWRDHIRSPDDIWDEIVQAASDIPGVTSAPKLQPIETRLVMLQTGMRAPLGLKVFGPDLKAIEAFSLRLVEELRQVPSVKTEAVYADRSLGKPYLEIALDRGSLARHGLSVGAAQHYLEVAVGGMALTTTVEGRERFDIRARYAREWRDDPEALRRILIPTPAGQYIPLGDIAEIRYRSGPMMIRGEDTFLVGYVMLDKRDGFAEVTVVQDAERHLRERIASGSLEVPAGVSYRFSGAYENQVRAEKRLAVVIPLVLGLIFLILYLQFRSTATALMIFSTVALSFAGGFLMLWLYGQDWFLNFRLLGVDMRDLFQIRAFNLSVAVWVGFIALFGIATDNGVVMAAYLKQRFAQGRPGNVAETRRAVMEAGLRRVRPCLMTTATTLLALLPILTSRGRGSDIMIPMAIPAFGGMTVALITLFLVPVLYALAEERKLARTGGSSAPAEEGSAP